jgi:hypothetical protein
MYADITVFDPATIIDRSTIREPTLPAVGVDAVIVNGRMAWRDGIFVAGAGQPLRRSSHEPSRPMDLHSHQSVTASARFAGGIRVRADVASEPGAAARAVGRVRIDGLPGGGYFEFDEIGLLQTHRGWAALTGTGRGRDGRRSAATLFIESADPLQRSKPTMSLRIDGATVAGGPLTGGRLAVNGVLVRPGR